MVNVPSNPPQDDMISEFSNGVFPVFGMPHEVVWSVASVCRLEFEEETPLC